MCITVNDNGIRALSFCFPFAPVVLAWFGLFDGYLCLLLFCVEYANLGCGGDARSPIFW
jgi:hypothetical protein